MNGQTVRLQGADKKAIDRKKMEYAYPPEPGSVIIHNEAEQWSAVKPEINANEAAEDGRAIKLMLAVGAQLPEHFLYQQHMGNISFFEMLDKYEAILGIARPSE